MAVSPIALRDLVLDLAKACKGGFTRLGGWSTVDAENIEKIMQAFHTADIGTVIDPPGWLIERNDLGAPQYCMFGPSHGFTSYTANASDALRFARKVDAEAFMRHHEHNDPVLRVTEHAWLDASPSPADGEKR